MNIPIYLNKRPNVILAFVNFLFIFIFSTFYFYFLKIIRIIYTFVAKIDDSAMTFLCFQVDLLFYQFNYQDLHKSPGQFVVEYRKKKRISEMLSHCFLSFITNTIGHLFSQATFHCFGAPIENEFFDCSILIYLFTFYIGHYSPLFPFLFLNASLY